MTRIYDEADRALAREFGARVRARRIELGMERPADLARAIDNGFSSMSAIERGSFVPKPRMMLAIAAALEVSVSYLLGDLDPDGDYRAGYRTALADIEHAMHDNLKELRQKGTG